LRNLKQLAPAFLAGFFIALLGFGVIMMLADTVARIGAANGG